MKYAVKGEGDYALPFLLFVPSSENNRFPVVIYLHEQGKSSQAAPGGEIEQLVQRGYLVAAVDPLGVGELKSTVGRTITAGYTGVLTGRSVIGLQAGDVVRILDYLYSRQEVDQANIAIYGQGRMAITALHTAAFDQRITATVLQSMPISYRSMVLHRDIKLGLTPRVNGGYWHPYEVDFDWGVAGALQHYDLPDLMATLAPRKLWLINPQNHLLEDISQAELDYEMAYPLTVFHRQQQDGLLKISSAQISVPEWTQWCFER